MFFSRKVSFFNNVLRKLKKIIFRCLKSTKITIKRESGEKLSFLYEKAKNNFKGLKKYGDIFIISKKQ
jgi:hypothetical protein